MKKQRSLTLKEKNFLDKELNRLKKRKEFQYKFLSGYIVLAFLTGIISYFYLDSTSEHFLLIGTVLVFILIGCRVFFQNYVEVKKQEENIVVAKKLNSVTSIEVTSKKYIQLSEVDDEGVHYLFQLAGNQILYFGGQDFYPNKRFPSDHFELAICKNEKGETLFLKKYMFGPKLKPVLKVTGQKKWELLANINYPDQDAFLVFNGTLESLEEMLAKA